MIDLNIGPGPTILLSLLKIEGVVLVGLVGGAADQPVKYGRVVLNAGADFKER
jgi:hypothetical protein